LALGLKGAVKKEAQIQRNITQATWKEEGERRGQGSMTGLIYALHLSKRTYKQ